MIQRSRFTSKFNDNFVIFLVGMRINSLLPLNKWWPYYQAIPDIINELRAQPELGCLHAELWRSRTSIMIQYWRSISDLHAYLNNTCGASLPAWKKFNEAANTDGVVGIWQEAYRISPGHYDTIYVNMPPFDLKNINK
jgi:hypothetical protein